MRSKYRFLIEITIGLVISVGIAWSFLSRTTFIETASLKTYDLLINFRAPASKSNAIKIIEIDEESVQSLGRWPWPRSIVAALIDELFGYGAKVIGVNIFFSDADQNEGLEEISRLEESFREILDETRLRLRRKRISLVRFDEFLQDLEDTRMSLNGDKILSRSIDEAGNVILPMYFTPGVPQGENLDPLPTYFEKEEVKGSTSEEIDLPLSIAAGVPLTDFGSVAAAIGHSNLDPDLDGTVRRMAPVMKYGDRVYPSFGLQIIREYKNLPRDAFGWDSSTEFALRSFKVPIDDSGTTFLQFAGPAGTFDRHSALDVLAGAVPEKELMNKMVLVGLTAPGLGQNFVVPSGEAFTGLELLATHIDNILSQRFMSRPTWASHLEWGFIGICALFIILGLPFLRGRFSVPLALIIFLGVAGTSAFLFVKKGMWVTPVYGLSLLLVGFLFSLGRRLLFTEKGKELVEAEGLETNKMLGLSFQGQGMLDLAFEKFRKCPLDSQMKDLLYNLGLDMERKRQFAKAAAVYEHIGSVDLKYKDIQKKIELLKKAGEGAVFGSVGKKGSDATVVVEGLGQSTTLGRYEVVRELGRGAMGIVYLGKDPKINRQVAIKTLRFEEDVDEEQAKSIKERFFREAESAGNLTHPNIIRIFDAGEDQDVAYIAMELIEGEDLKRSCEKANLLPFERVVEYVAQVAEALAFAHNQGVVHRDIKPGNIMLLANGTLRITDFGIARIQATSKTATGAVLGTPAYMSPEQVNGKKVDGRADIFSLGVTLFELLTGEKPFVADSIAALLYRIANVDHPDPREFNPKLPEAIVPVINKALAKDLENRYQTADDMARDLRTCLNQMIGTAPAPIPIAINPEKPPAPPKKENIASVPPKPPVEQMPPAQPPAPTPPIEQTPPAQPPASAPPTESMGSKPPISDVPDSETPKSSLEQSSFLSDLQDVLKTSDQPQTDFPQADHTSERVDLISNSETIDNGPAAPDDAMGIPEQENDKTVLDVGDKTMVDNDKTIIDKDDKTVVMESDSNFNIPLMDNLESTYHPPFKDPTTDKNQVDDK
ncbi:hypothetical protein BVX98_00165 [bacterium F11]|nr:hypothetical protein BVX98_00165 [bacterium F11]